MSDIHNNANPFIQFGKTPPTGDDAKRKPSQQEAASSSETPTFTPRTDHKNPNVIFGAMGAQAQAAQSQVVENRIVASLRSLPSPEAVARFSAQAQAEFPGLGPEAIAEITSSALADSLLGKVVVTLPKP